MKKRITPMQFVVAQILGIKRVRRSLPRVPHLPDDVMLQAVHDAGGINKAAKLVGMSPSTFCRRISAIRRQPQQ